MSCPPIVSLHFSLASYCVQAASASDRAFEAAFELRKKITRQVYREVTTALRHPVDNPEDTTENRRKAQDYLSRPSELLSTVGTRAMQPGADTGER